jgi:hypothetical protein
MIMKKTFTLLASFGIISLASAQPGGNYKNYPNNDNRIVYSNNHNGGYDKNDRNGRYNDKFDNRYNMAERARDREIDRINREYDIRIDRVMNNHFLSRGQRMKQVKQLEKTRNNEIRNVYYNFDCDNNKSHRH